MNPFMMPYRYMKRQKRRGPKRSSISRKLISRDKKYKHKHPNADLDKDAIREDRNRPITEDDASWSDIRPPASDIRPPAEPQPPTGIIPPDGAGRDTVEIDLPEGIGAGASTEQRALFTRIRDFVSGNINRSGKVTNSMIGEIKAIQEGLAKIRKKGLLNKQLKKAGEAVKSLLYSYTGSTTPKAGDPWNPDEPEKLKPLPTIPRDDKNRRVTKKGIWSVVTITHYPGTRNQRIEKKILRRGKDIIDSMNIMPGHVLSTPVGTYRYIGEKKFGYSGWKPEKGPIIDRDLLPSREDSVRSNIVRNTLIPYLRNMNISDDVSDSILIAFLNNNDQAMMSALQRSNMTNDEIELFLEKISFEPEEGSDSRLVKPRKTEPKIAQSHKWYGFPTEAYDKKKKAVRVTTVGEY